MENNAKLIVLSENLKGASFKLSKDSYTCGKKEERDICLDDPTVSSYHCDFVRTENTYTVYDKQSTNGTRVNNLPIEIKKLQNTDIIQIGKVEILFECDDKSVKTVMKTRTNIDFDKDDGTGTVEMDNVSPFKHKKGSSLATVLLYVVVILLIIMIIVLILYLGGKIITQETTQLKLDSIITCLT